MTIELRGAGKYSNEEAQGLLTLGEANAIQRHYGEQIGLGLYGLELAAGLVWAIERRECLAVSDPKLTSWADVDSIPLEALSHYFTDEIEVDPEDPETPSGKDNSPDA